MCDDILNGIYSYKAYYARVEEFVVIQLHNCCCTKISYYTYLVHLYSVYVHVCLCVCLCLFVEFSSVKIIRCMVLTSSLTTNIYPPVSYIYCGVLCCVSVFVCLSVYVCVSVYMCVFVCVCMRKTCLHACFLGWSHVARPIITGYIKT